MNNNSSQSRFAKITAKVIVMLLAVVMAVSVLPELSADIFPAAEAATTETYTVPADASTDVINNYLAQWPEGTVVNMTFIADFNFTNTSTDTFGSSIIGMVIPAGITVNMFLNGRSIIFDRSSGGAWQMPAVYGIHNKGTLNIYSGASVTGSSSAASITIRNVRTGMSPTDEHESAYCALEAIHNEGALTVNKGVNIVVDAKLHYDKVNTNGNLFDYDCAQVSVGAAGISSVGTKASCSVYAANITINGFAEGSNSSNGSDSYSDSAAFAFGIYGGNVSVSGDTNINVTSNGNHSRDTYSGNASDGKSYLTSLALGIATSGSVSVTGGTITHDANITNTDAAKSDGGGRQYLYSAGIYTTTGSIPYIPECTITTSEEDCMNNSEGTVTYRKGTVLTGSSMMRNATDLVAGMMSRSHKDQVAVTVSAGSYSDEANNSYTTEVATNVNGIPKAMNKGALEGTNRVHIIYRYWETSGKKNIVNTIVGTEGNVGYSFNPLDDGTNVVNTEVVLNGVTGGTKVPGAKLSYKSGAESCNEYYWELIGVYWATTSSAFSDYNFTSATVKGTAIKTFFDTGAADKPYTSNDGAVYIFVDYAMLEAKSIKANVGTANTVNTVYTGSPIKASDLGLLILDSIYETDYTSEYNIDFEDDTLINVNFTYSGSNAAGVEENGTGRLPTNAGTYAVKLSIPESTTYSKEPKTNKNRYALEYTFTLIIEQASIGRGDLPESVTLTYGETLAEVLQLANKTAQGLKNEAGITGTFTFANPADGSAYKTVSKNQLVSVTWTPSYSTTATAKNYKVSEFNVVYNVNKAKLTIIANDATVVYGNSDPDYSVTLEGLVAQDKNSETAKAAITAAIQYTILPAGATDYTAYSAGAFAVGSYPIRITLPPASAPQVLDNYEYSLSWGDGFGRLDVTKRPITVIADGREREYSASDYSYIVDLLIKDGGKYANDDVSFKTLTGSLTSNNAGSYQINITIDQVRNSITGGTAGNYEVVAVEYSTGNTLYFTITKAVPSVTTPVVADRYYQSAVTLKNVVISAQGSAVKGSWAWEDESIIPTVNQKTYKAVFTPTDSVNYDTKAVEVTINVKPTPVVISYSATVSYGDNIPNITAYTYKSDLDPDFSIDNVKTSGNVTPSTTYVKGAPVIAGGYPVTISAPNFIDTDGNYIFSAGDGVITVVPRTITFTPEDVKLTYGDTFIASASTVKVNFDEALLVGNDTIESITSNGEAPRFSYGTTFNSTSAYAVGTYTLTITPAFATSANYTVETKTGKVEVVKADLVIKAKDTTLTYGSEVPQDILTSVELIGAKRGEDINKIVTSGSIHIATTYTSSSPVNAEGYAISVDVTDVTINNYNVSVENGTITVIKATPVITTVPTAKITYTDSLAAAVFEGGAVSGGIAGKFVYDSASTVPVYSESAVTIYAASFIPADTNNYNTVRNIYAPLTIERKEIAGALAVNGTPMVGVASPLTVDVSGLNPAEIGYYTISWYLGGSATASATGTSYSIPANAEKQTLKVVAVANAPYKGTVEYTLTIAPELADINVLLSDMAANFVISGLENSVYDAQAHEVQFAQAGSTMSSVQLGGITVKYNGSTNLPIDAGTYKVTVDVATPDAAILAAMTNGMYNGKTVYSPVANYYIGDITITPATYTVSVVIADKSYDGTSKAYLASAAESGALADDQVSFDKANAEFAFAKTQVGTFAVSVKKAALTGADAANYTIVCTIANEGGTAKILKKDLHVEIVPVEREYSKDNTNIDLSFVIDESDIAAGDIGFVAIDEENATASVETDGAAKDKAVTVSNIALTGDKAGNYNLVLTNVNGLTVDVNKATPSYPVPQPITLSYDSARKLSMVDVCDGDARWSWRAQDMNTVLGAGTYKYTAVFTPDDSVNYATVEREVSITITKATVTITADSFSVVYGEIEPTYSYKVKGLTGTDTIKTSVDGFVLLNCAYQAGNDIGTYPIVLTGAFESENYNFVYTNGSVTVNRRPAYVDAVAVGREFEEGNLSVEVKFTNLSNIYSGDGAGVVSLAAESVMGTVSDPDAGSDKPVTYSLPALTGSKAENYELRVLNPKVYVEIAKATLSGISLPTAGQLYYGQKLSSIEFTENGVSAGLGTFTMENPTTVVNKIGTFKDTYKVVFTPFNTKNYNTVSQYIDVTVIPAYINIALSISGTTQVGKILYVVTNDIPVDAYDYLNFEWYRVDSADADPKTGYKVASGTDTYTLTEADEGKYIICTVTTEYGAPYECNARCVTGSSIEEQTLTLWQKFINWFYRIISNLTQLFGGAFG